MASETSGGGGSGVIREMLAVFGIGLDTSEVDKGEDKLSDFVGKLKTLAAGLAGAFAVKEVIGFANAQAALLDRLDDTATALGISTERVQQLRFASESMGDDADKLLNLVGRLQVMQQAAAGGNKTVAASFATLGVGLKDANGHMKTADELLLDVADGIQKIKDPSQAAAVATKLFGRSGRELLPFLQQGRAGAEHYFQTFKDIGGGYTKEAIDAGSEYQESTAELTLGLRAFTNYAVTKLLPVLTRIARTTTDVVGAFFKFTQSSNIVKATLLVLGAAATYFAAQMAIAAAPVLLIAAAIGGLVLLVDDLITLFEGGDTLIGRTIDKIFGKDAHTNVVEEIKTAWQGVRDVFNELRPGTQHLWDFFKFLIEKQETIGKIVSYLPPVLAVRGLYKASEFVGAHALVGTGEEPTEYTGKHGSSPNYPTPYAGAPQVPPYMQPIGYDAPGTGAGVLMGDTYNNITMNLPPGMDPKQAGEQVANAIDQKAKQRRREAAATLPRAGR